MTNMAVVFQSGHGHTRALAEAALAGINQVAGMSSSLLEIEAHDVKDGRYANESLMARLDATDGIIFGCATYMGSASAVYKAFLEAAFAPHWREQRWKDKVAAGFTNSASQNGDKLTTLFQLAIFAMQMGMLWVGVGDLPGNNWSGGARSDINRLGTWMGAMGQSNADEESPSIGDIDTAQLLGSRVAEIARRIKAGTPFQTIRLNEKKFRENNVRRKEMFAISGTAKGAS